MREPPQPKIDDKVFWAWNRRRTVQRRIDGVTKIQRYLIDTVRWNDQFRDYLKPRSPPRREPETEELTAIAPVSTESVLRQVTDKIRPRYDNRQTPCLHCGRPATATESACSEACLAAFVEASADVEATHVELRRMDFGYGVFVRPGSGGLPEGTELGLYLGELIPYDLSEVDAPESSSYLFELHAGGKKSGKPKNQICVDAKTHGNWTRFVNSNCNPNCKVEHIVLGKSRYLLFQTKREVPEGQELTISYGPDYFRDGNTQCLCDAQPEPHIPPPFE